MLYILALLLSLAAGWWVYRADAKRDIPLPWLTALLRTLAFVLLFILLLAPSVLTTKNETRKPVIVFLQDNSLSIRNALGADTASYKSAVQSLTQKLSNQYKLVQLSFGADLQKQDHYDFSAKATDISSALQQLQESYGQQNLGAVIMATDGRYNLGADPLYQELVLKAKLYTVSIGDTAVQKDIAITKVYANKTAALNSSFEIRADVVATACKGYQGAIRLTEGNENLSAENITATEDWYDRSVAFTVTAQKAGLHHYTITIPSADGEVNTANNRKEVFVEVKEEKKIIYIVAAAPHPDVNAIKEALDATSQFKITVQANGEMPADAAKADLLILHNLPSVTRPGLVIPQHVPVWYIAGTQVNMAQLNQLQDAAVLQLNPGMLQDVLPAYNKSFSGYILPPTISSVMDKMAPLSRPVGNVKLNAGTEVLISGRDDNSPLWFQKRGGNSVAILAGEGIWRWRLYEYRFFNEHNIIDECIRQTVSYLTSDASKEPFQVTLPKFTWADQEPVSFSATLLNAGNQQVNDPDVQLTITDSSGAKQAFQFERSGTAYRINTGLHAGGIYHWVATTTLDGRKMSREGSFAVESIPLELVETGANYPLLHSLARKHGGSVVLSKNIASLYDSITANKSIVPVIDTITDARPLIDWKWYFFLVLALLTTEWLLRKYWMAQ